MAVAFVKGVAVAVAAAGRFLCLTTPSATQPVLLLLLLLGQGHLLSLQRPNLETLLKLFHPVYGTRWRPP